MIRHTFTVKVGDTLSGWTIIGDGGKAKPKTTKRWLCRDAHGNEREMSQFALLKMAGLPFSDVNFTHPLFRTWMGMNDRCHSPKSDCYYLYGARGIRVCDRWRHSFTDFVADVGPKPSPKHTLDRKDNSGDYTPENCHWVTMSVQNRNRRGNVWLTYQGVTLIQTDWAARLGISLRSLKRRIASWPFEKAFSTPKMH